MASILGRKRRRRVRLQELPVLPYLRALPSTEEIAIFLGKVPQMNKYEIYRELVRRDPQLNYAITQMSMLVQKSYRGITLKAGPTLEEREKRLLEAAQKDADRLNFEKLFFITAKNLLTYGDFICLKNYDHDGKIVFLQPLPIPYVTILEDLDQKNNVAAQIFEANFYILNEGTEKEQDYTKDEIVHFALDNYAEEVNDLKGRYTFSVWSVSPLESLKTILFWKLSTILTDILWRKRSVPREHHKLDLSAFSPELFSGATLEERINKAKKAAEDELKSYAERVRARKPDEGYITGKGVEIEYIEPKKVTYVSPNELIAQLDNIISQCFGIFPATTYATAVYAGSYTMLYAEVVATRIKEKLLEVLKENLKDKFDEDELAKLDIKLEIILARDRSEVIRQIAVLAATGAFTRDELRELLGFLPLTEEQKKELTEIMVSGRGRRIAERTIEDIVSAVIRRIREPERRPPVTPESKKRWQIT